MRVQLTYLSGKVKSFHARWVGVDSTEIRGEDGLVIATQYPPSRGWIDPRTKETISQVDVFDS